MSPLFSWLNPEDPYIEYAYIEECNEILRLCLKNTNFMFIIQIIFKLPTFFFPFIMSFMKLVGHCFTGGRYIFPTREILDWKRVAQFESIIDSGEINKNKDMTNVKLLEKGFKD